MYNCGGHGPELNFPNVTFRYLSPRSTEKNQPLDLGIIAHSKTRFRFILLRKSIDIILKLKENDENRSTSSQQGMLNINDGFLPDFSDTMELFDVSWSRNSRLTVTKCWIKSQCLHLNQVKGCRSLMRDLSVTANDMNVKHITRSDPINAGEIRGLSNDLAVIQAQSVQQTPLSRIVEEIEGIDNAVNLATSLNRLALFDVEPSRSEISDSQLQDLFDSHRTNLSTDLSSSPSADTGNRVDVSNHISKIKNHMEEVLKQIDDRFLCTAAADFINRAEELKRSEFFGIAPVKN